MPVVEYRWKIKYPDGRKSQAGPWLASKRKVMKNFFQCLSNDKELLSSWKKEMDEIVYLDKRVQRTEKDQSIRNKGNKYMLFRWKMKCFWGLPIGNRPYEGEWTHIKGERTKDFQPCVKEFLHLGYDVADCWGSKEYLYMRRPLPLFKKVVNLMSLI